MSIRIKTHDGTLLALEPREGDTLAKTIVMSRLWHGVALCSGLGKCGLCKVRFTENPPEPVLEEKKKLGEEALAQGWRLSCLHPSESCDIELPAPTRSQRAVRTTSTTTGDFSLAIDLGTTSIHWSVLIGNESVATGHELNPQMGLGSEIMSRLAVAANAEGRFILRALILDRLTELVRLASHNMQGKCVSMAVSGNSAMTYVLLGKKPDDLASAPYTLSYFGGEEKKLGADLPPAYIAPLLAPFIGADLSAGLTAIEYDADVEYPFLLADLGTNGEFILALGPDKRLCASVPMGPALEGVGLTHGRTAGPGAVTGFRLTPKELQKVLFDESHTPPTGMTGTGYISLTATLIRHGILDDSGQFGQGTTPLAAKLAKDLITTEIGEPAFALDHGLMLPASDIEEILKVKAAFNLAMSALLHEAQLKPSALKTIYIAGALGEHVSLNDLETIGFLPPNCKNRTVKAGNTALKGSELLVTDPDARRFAETLPTTITALDLASDASFGDQFMKRMRFTYVD
ncbi:MAG: FeS-binding protein [Desulfovibrio sp.]|mgnify:CR=1 FL=1|nr:FeS-binding protein [Desulfovibrio sp.]